MKSLIAGARREGTPGYQVVPQTSTYDRLS